ncbi:TadE/TadG family type IV pilus assembly protein [Altericroceibacterium endophyticum]|uniref:Pilus assembly protein n=1 Tax=Altericroceibacterium endophyticum TaxID=1808508 RepID=A0A6I4T4K0_9SPHN|nr:TadE family protein [Altericroceibacterium endophyticum]MXO65132.1 pilus assembly protein [Altericroceibacterium endophyticum]
MMLKIRQMMACRSGAAIIEFALLAPIFIAMLIGLIEFSRLLWTRHTLDEVAYSTSRCMSMDSVCDTDAKAKAFAKNRARGLGVAILEADVTPQDGTSCRQLLNANEVTIEIEFNSPLMSFVPGMSGEIISEGCYPVLGSD